MARIDEFYFVPTSLVNVKFVDTTGMVKLFITHVDYQEKVATAFPYTIDKKTNMFSINLDKKYVFNTYNVVYFYEALDDAKKAFHITEEKGGYTKDERTENFLDNIKKAFDKQKEEMEKQMEENADKVEDETETETDTDVVPEDTTETDEDADVVPEQ